MKKKSILNIKTIFFDSTEIKEIKSKKYFKELDLESQNEELEKLFLSKFISIEKEKNALFFLDFQSKHNSR